jgi:hypothetical protein
MQNPGQDSVQINRWPFLAHISVQINIYSNWRVTFPALNVEVYVVSVNSSGNVVDFAVFNENGYYAYGSSPAPVPLQDFLDSNNLSIGGSCASNPTCGSLINDLYSDGFEYRNWLTSL